MEKLVLSACLKKFLRYIIPGLLLCSSAASADDGNSSNNSLFSLPVVAAIICYFRRKEPIGGWLLFYFFTVWYGAFNSIPMILHGVGGGWLPSGFASSSDYLMFLLTSMPTNLCILAEIVLSILLMMQNTRDKKYVNMLKIALVIDFVASVISLPMDISSADYAAATISFLHVLLSSIWFFYFKQSCRVKLVFDEKNWDYSEFMSLKINKGLQKAPEEAARL